MANILFMGDSATGKTQLFNALVGREFDLKYETTIGANFFELPELVIWDTSGSKSATSSDQLKAQLMKAADICVLCVDLSIPLAEHDIAYHLERVKTKTQNSDQKIPFILVGTKSDLDRVVSDKAFNQLAELFDASIIVSSKLHLHTKDFENMLVEFSKNPNYKFVQPISETNMEIALAKLPSSSALYQKIKLLQNYMVDLTQSDQSFIGKKVLDLVNNLLSKETPISKADHISQFENECMDYLKVSHPKTVSLIMGIAVTALVTLVAATVGFGIGFLAGAWTGPGAFISGVMAGAIAAEAVVASSITLGVGLGFFAGIKHYNSLAHPKALIDGVVETARDDERAVYY